MSGTVVPLLTTLYLAEPSESGSWDTWAADLEQFVQGTASNSFITRNGFALRMYTLPGVVDLRNTHIYTWVNNAVSGFMATKALGGWRIRVQDNATNWGEWYMGGSDTYFGGWTRLICDTSGSFQANSGTDPDLQNIAQCGIRCYVPNIVQNKINTWIDAMRYGEGLQIINGTESDPAEMEDFWTADNAVANKWGVVNKSGGVYFLAGKIILGSSSSGSSVYFKDDGKVLIYQEDENWKVANDLFEFRIDANSSGSCNVQLGDAITVSGEKIVTSNFTLRAPAGYSYLLDMSNTQIDSLKLYGFQTYRANDILIGDTGKQLGGTIHMVDNQLSAIQKMHRNLTGSNFYGSGNLIPFALSTSYALKMFDDHGYNYAEYALIGGYGLSSNQSEVLALDYRSIVADQDVEIAVSNQVWNFIDPIWSTSGSPIIDWTVSSGSVFDKASIDIVFEDTGGDPIEGALYFVDEETDDIAALNVSSGSDGSIYTYLCDQAWWDETNYCKRGPFTRRTWAYGKDPTQAAMTINGGIYGTLTLTTDTGVELSQAQAQAVTGVTVGYHSTPYSAQGKDWTWVVDGGDNTLVNIYSWLSDQYVNSGSAPPWLDQMRLERTRLIERSGTFYTERIESHGVYIMNYAGDVDYMTADDGTLYYPPVNVDFKLTNLVAGSEIGIYTSGSMTEVYHLESSGSTATYNYDWTGDQSVYVVIHSVNYVPITIENLTLGNTDQTIPVSQQYDRNYDNP